MDRESKSELKKFSQKLVDLAYQKETRQEILMFGINSYFRLLLLELSGERKLYRSREEMKEGMRLKSFNSNSIHTHAVKAICFAPREASDRGRWSLMLAILRC